MTLSNKLKFWYVLSVANERAKFVTASVWTKYLHFRVFFSFSFVSCFCTKQFDIIFYLFVLLLMIEVRCSKTFLALRSWIHKTLITLWRNFIIIKRKAKCENDKYIWHDGIHRKLGKIWALDGVQTHDPPQSGRMLYLLSCELQCGFLIQAASRNNRIIVSFRWSVAWHPEKRLRRRLTESRSVVGSNPIWGSDFSEFPVDSIVTPFHVINTRKDKKD